MRIHKGSAFQCDCPNFPKKVSVDETGKRGARIGTYFLQKEKHMMVHHEGLYGCGKCQKFFQTKTKLSSHMLSHRKTSCQSCQKEIQVNCLTYHMKKHEVDPCHCLICGKIFPNKFYLAIHNSVHKSDTLCPDCGGNFTHLKLHIENKHKSDKEKKFGCPKCGKGLSSLISLKSHEMSVHLKLHPYQCRYGCENRYNDVNNRAAHERKRHGGVFNKVNLKIQKLSVFTIIKPA